MTVCNQPSEVSISMLHDEVHQVLTGAARAKGAEAASKIEEMKVLTTQEWQNAARALLLARKTSLLGALSMPVLEAVAFGHVDVRRSLSRAIELVDEHAAMRRVQDIACRRLNLPLEEADSSLHSLETGLVHDALMEAYVAGANSRFA